MLHNQPSSFSVENYKVGIICALPKELLAVRALFDEEHEGLRTAKEDMVHYSLGRMGRHLVTTACLPSGEYGTNAAAAVMQNMRRTFPQLESCLFVGIGGGVPSSEHDIRLGDVVVSHRIGPYPAVVQHDMGKILEDGSFENTGILQSPPQLLMTAISSLMSNPNLKENSLQTYLKRIGEGRPAYRFPGREHDVLFAADSPHVTGNNHCHNCGAVVNRPERVSDQPQIFYGPIGSGNQVIKSAVDRDLLWQRHKILCFEMEAAGVMNTFPCLIIRGICDYADSHKIKIWQEYAAATAAAYSRLLLSVLRDHHDNFQSFGPNHCEIQAGPSTIALNDDQDTTRTNAISLNTNDMHASPEDGASLSGPQDSPEESIDRSAILQVLQPERNREEVLQECFLLARRSPSWNPWPKDISSFHLFQSLNRWISDPACSLLVVRGTPGRLFSELPDSEIFAYSVIQFLREKTDFPVIWTLSSRRIGDRCAEPMKAIISQALAFNPNIPLARLSQNWDTSQTPSEEQLLDLMHDIVCQLPESFVVIEIKHATLATRIRDVLERGVHHLEGNPKILIVGYDIQWRNSNSVAVENGTMPSVRLRSSRPGWDPCWNVLKPRFT